jgi:Mlc titration factor MtfA (ptsG expression regulator)
MSPENFLAAAGIIAAAVVFYSRWRRHRMLQQPFKPEWLAIVRDALPFFPRMSADEQQQLLDLVRLFLAGKTFHGCNGQIVDDTVRVVIAAQACLLLLNRSTQLFPSCRHILVYPDAFVREGEFEGDDGVVSSHSEELLGESWGEGKVILSWDDVLYGLEDFGDGENVVLHEFAHQLDAESGSQDGAPVLKRNDPAEWKAVMTAAFDVLNESADMEEETLMDPYGATDPAEFFAVATETFFECADEMALDHPALFSELKKYYCVDPRQWR